MKTMMTVAEVVQTAFGDAELPEGVLSEQDVRSAQLRHLAPALGRAMYGAVLEGRYAELLLDVPCYGNGIVARTAACAVSHAHEIGLKSGYVVHRRLYRLEFVACLGGKHLERERCPFLVKYVCYLHKYSRL